MKMRRNASHFLRSIYRKIKLKTHENLLKKFSAFRQNFPGRCGCCLCYPHRRVYVL